MSKIKLNLQLFGEGGGAGGAAGGEGAGGTGAEGAAAAAESLDANQGKAGKGGRAAAEDLSKVVYGKQEAEAAMDQQPEAETEPQKADQAEKDQQPAKRQTFDELMKADPEYQKEMQRRIDQAINRRFAKSKAAEEQLSELMPALNLLAPKYGVQAGDTKGLVQAINSDNDLIEQQAMDAGMEPEAYMEFQRVKAENAALKQEKEQREREAFIQSEVQRWNQQAEEARHLYPNLDLRVESQDEFFMNMLNAGVDVKTAYEVRHNEEIQRGLIQKAAAEATQKTVASIAAKSGRPRENGASRPQAATVKNDYTKLTIKDYYEIDRRLQRGEVIRY